MDNKKNNIDWERIEAEYRCGIKSIREIAAIYGCTDTAIRKKAKRENWVRDLSAKIRAKADDLVRTQAVRNLVRTETPTEKEKVEANAKGIAAIDLEHRADVRRSRNIVQKLLDELDDQVGNKELYEQLADLMHSPDDKGADKLNDIYRKVISFGGRTDNVKKLADSLKVLVELERKIVKLDDLPASSDKQIGVEVSFV